MNEPDPSGPLLYTLATTPDELTRPTPGRPHHSRLEIKATRNPAIDTPLDCGHIAVTIPTGTHPNALTNQPHRIDTAYRTTTRGRWSINANTTHPDHTVFCLTPHNPRRLAHFDDTLTLTLVLDGIPVTATPGDINLHITDDTSTPTRAHTLTTTTIPLTIH